MELSEQDISRGVCEHGLLRRSCEICELKKENELLYADKAVLESKWRAQGLMIQKLHKDNHDLVLMLRNEKSLQSKTANNLRKLRMKFKQIKMIVDQ